MCGWRWFPLEQNAAACAGGAQTGDRRGNGAGGGECRLGLAGGAAIGAEELHAIAEQVPRACGKFGVEFIVQGQDSVVGCGERGCKSGDGGAVVVVDLAAERAAKDLAGMFRGVERELVGGEVRNGEAQLDRVAGTGGGEIGDRSRQVKRGRTRRTRAGAAYGEERAESEAS